jgi:hypothetical protein
MHALIGIRCSGGLAINTDPILSPYYKVVFGIIPVVSLPKSPAVAVK